MPIGMPVAIFFRKYKYKVTEPFDLLFKNDLPNCCNAVGQTVYQSRQMENSTIVLRKNLYFLKKILLLASWWGRKRCLLNWFLVTAIVLWHLLTVPWVGL